MNRQQRRAQARRTAHRLADGLATATCPDCNADTRLTQAAPGVLTLTVMHDPTCPWMKHREVSR